LKPLVAHFGASLVRKITYEHLVEYRQKRFETPTRRGSQRSVSQVNRELSLMRSIFTYAKRLNIIQRSPFDAGASLISLADETRRDRILTPDEEKRLLAQCVGQRAHLRYLVIAALDTGMRKGELLQLLWSDVNFEKGVIVVRSTTTKTRRPRTIGMTARLIAALSELLELTQAGAGDFVFGGIKDCKKAFRSACREAKITDLRFHDLRHTATTRLVQAGAPPSITMKMTGHTQFSTFARYVNPDHNAAREAASFLDDFNQKGE
jgi:integrase